MSAQVHDTKLCDCSWCQWADEQQRKAQTITRKEHLQQLRKSLVEEINRLHVELNRVDDEYDAIEDQETKQWTI